MHTPVTQNESAFRARPFGLSPADLDMDFGQPAVVSVNRILQQCLEAQTSSRQQVLEWSLARRLQALLQIVIMTRGDALTLDVRCSKMACGELVEVQLPLSGFVQDVDESPVCCRPQADVMLHFRLPNGQDQLDWLDSQQSQASSSSMAQHLLEAVNDQSPPLDFVLPEAWLENIEAELEQRDPLMTLELETHCPQCERKLSIPLDLEHQLLKILQAEQQKLFYQIHTLAQHYHWNEQDIMALSTTRRQYYLALLNRDAGWS